MEAVGLSDFLAGVLFSPFSAVVIFVGGEDGLAEDDGVTVVNVLYGVVLDVTDLLAVLEGYTGDIDDRDFEISQ